MAQEIKPNHYELEGPGLSVRYSLSSTSGEPQLTFKRGRQTLNFSGSEIGTLEAMIGTLITVTIAKTADREFTSFSFLVPGIDLSSASAKQSFRSLGVTTVHKTSIGGQVKGAQQVYKLTHLRGKARQIAFLVQKTASV